MTEFGERWMNGIFWVTQDPKGTAAGSNLYEPLGNDPTNNTDPTGLDWNPKSEDAATILRKVEEKDPEALAWANRHGVSLWGWPSLSPPYFNRALRSRANTVIGPDGRKQFHVEVREYLSVDEAAAEYLDMIRGLRESYWDIPHDGDEVLQKAKDEDPDAMAWAHDHGIVFSARDVSLFLFKPRYYLKNVKQKDGTKQLVIFISDDMSIASAASTLVEGVKDAGGDDLKRYREGLALAREGAAERKRREIREREQELQRPQDPIWQEMMERDAEWRRQHPAEAAEWDATVRRIRQTVAEAGRAIDGAVRPVVEPVIKRWIKEEDMPDAPGAVGPPEGLDGWEEYIPLWGPVRAMINDFQSKRALHGGVDYAQALLDATLVGDGLGSLGKGALGLLGREGLSLAGREGLELAGRFASGELKALAEKELAMGSVEGGRAFLGIGKDAPRPSGPLNNALKEAMLNQATSPWFRWRVNTWSWLTGRGAFDWDAYMAKLANAEFREYASAGEMIQSLGWAGYTQDGERWLFGVAGKDIPVYGEATMGHELFHAAQDMKIPGILKGGVGFLRSVAVEYSAYLWGSPIVGVPLWTGTAGGAILFLWEGYDIGSNLYTILSGKK